MQTSVLTMVTNKRLLLYLLQLVIMGSKKCCFFTVRKSREAGSPRSLCLLAGLHSYAALRGR